MKWFIKKFVTLRTAHTTIVFRVVLPNKSFFQNKSGEPVLILTIKHWSSFVKILFFGTAGFSIDYVNSKIDIDGDLRYLAQLASPYQTPSHLAEKIVHEVKHPGTLSEKIVNWWHIKRTLPNTYKQAQYNAEFHYGHDPEFYDYYLGSTKAYSTGIWYPWTKTVEEAQYNKWGLVLKKLRLKPGMHIASLGSGFGFGEMMAALEYGVQVDCYNICRPQNAWLRSEIKRRGLEDKIHIIEENYTAIGQVKNKYDGLLFIESIEHAGEDLRRETIRLAAEALKDEAVGVIQWLSFPIETEVKYFIREYLYPGVEMPPLGRLIDDVVLAGCEVQDLFNGRRHYHYTLNAWYENFMNNWDNIQAINPQKYNQKMMRTWSLYLASGAGYYTQGDATARLFQLTFTKGTTDTYPMNRNFIYDEQADDSAWTKGTEWVLR